MAERPMRFDRRMSDTEALMWTIEKDPALRSSFLQITILDQQPDYERFRGRMARAVELLPRLRQRPSPAPVRLAGALAHNLRRQAGIAGRAAGNAASLATHPRRVPALVADSAEMARSIARQLAVVQKARSSLWTDRSLGRRFEILSVSLDDVKRAAKGLGGTVNDLFVAAVAGGAGAYHRAK